MHSWTTFYKYQISIKNQSRPEISTLSVQFYVRSTAANAKAYLDQILEGLTANKPTRGGRPEPHAIAERDREVSENPRSAHFVSHIRWDSEKEKKNTKRHHQSLERDTTVSSLSGPPRCLTSLFSSHRRARSVKKTRKGKRNPRRDGYFFFFFFSLFDMLSGRCRSMRIDADRTGRSERSGLWSNTTVVVFPAHPSSRKAPLPSELAYSVVEARS